MLVNYKKSNIFSVDTYQFKPGINEYTDLTRSKLDELAKKYPKLQYFMDEGDFEIVGGGSSASNESDFGQGESNQASLKGMKDRDAIALVKQTADMELLRRWQGETSGNVRKSVDDQIKAIEKAGEKD